MKYFVFAIIVIVLKRTMKICKVISICKK